MRIHKKIIAHGYAPTARQKPLSLHPSTLSQITKRIEEELRAGAFLGTDTFVEQLKPLLKEKPIDSEIRKEERFAARPSLEELFSSVSDKATRNERVHQAVRVHHYTLREVGDFLGCTSQLSVSSQNEPLRRRKTKNKELSLFAPVNLGPRTPGPGKQLAA